MQPLPVGKGYFYSSAIADLVGWVKERNPTMRNDNLIVESLQSLSDEVRTLILLARKYQGKKQRISSSQPNLQDRRSHWKRSEEERQANL